MKSTHLSTWDQEEYVLGQRTPEMVRHLAQCSSCFTEVERMERGIALFRESATVWSAECLEVHPLQLPAFAPRPIAAMPMWAWAVAAILFLLVLLPFGYQRVRSAANHQSAQVTAAPNSDDALLQQVDEEASVDVPSAMEPLAHLVSTSNGSAGVTGATPENKRRVQRD